MPRAKKKRQQLFRKVLIANRGEIACRIIGTCHRLGIKAVAVYSEADAHALHVQQADEAVLIGPPPAAESYLNIAAIIQAAQETGAEAVHPGYGFLSENADFVSACRDAGITFIGPSVEALERMKNKAEARHLAAEAGLPLLPGTTGAVDDKEALAKALEIGFPVMVKASQGGGGIGIRRVNSPEEMPEALARARSLAQSAFGSAQVYVEKFLEGPSHIEVQVLADHFGNAVHLYERDCSIQRRNQKVIEESPSVKLKRRRRKKMYEAALALVRYIGYTNAGTIEFLVDKNGRFYFVEMNTRLQVEHPVTEMITGLDMVELQIRIAAGEPLPFEQDDVHRKGHAIEARIYPEDPKTLLPVSGRLESVEFPTDEHIRVDSAIFPGYEILPYYDSLMAKVIAWGKDREKAIETLSKGLSSFQLPSITHNIPLVQAALANEEFKKGVHTTLTLASIVEQMNQAAPELSEKERVAVATAALGSFFVGPGAGQRPASPWKGYGRMTQVNPWSGRGARW
ncbi:MAG: acetyl-CoA carboxylase biotin carboxylase subunit [Chloroflexi bacterium]|nr:acetyl-CoA carboxylase biotin carboxylase subunit [Chloroflexota bacterium]